MCFRMLRIVIAAWCLVSMAFGQTLLPGGGVPEAKAAPVFHLPWEAGNVWQITHDGNATHHANEWNRNAWDAVPDAGRSTNRVTAIAGGVVLGFQNDVPKEAIFGLDMPHAGNCMLIRHDDGTVSIYAHLATGSIPGELLREGAEVRGGMVIGTVGDTGSADGVHLHWSLTSDGFMYEEYGYRTCLGRSIPSQYADNDAELIQDGGVPRKGRFYESTNVDSGTVQAPPPTQAPPAPTQAPPTATTAPIVDSDGDATAEPGVAQDADMVPMDIGASGPNGHEIGAQFTVTREDGTFLGSCTLEGERSVPILISCRVPVPRFTTVVVTLDVDTITPGYAPVENPVSFDTSSDPGAASHWGVFFQIEPDGSATITPEEPVSEASQSADMEPMSIIPVGPDGSMVDVGFTVTTEDGTFLGACAVAADFPEGNIPNCSVDVPRNTIVAVWFDPSSSTTDLTPVENPVYFDTSSDQDAQMWGPAFEFASAGAPGGNESSGAVDIALITREPEDGDLLTGACYELVGHSNEGCDENGDGQVTFAAIPYGTYTVRQTQTPAGYPTINDYEIIVEGTGYMEGPSFGVPLGFVVKQAPEQNAPNTRNVSVVFLDMVTHERMASGACVELMGASDVGCDRDLVDGQADFLDVPAGGPYELSFSNLPAGSEVATVGGPLALSIEAGPGDPSNVMLFVLLAGSNGAQNPTSSGTGSDSGEATMLMTFRGCPEGFDPNTGNFAADCTIPLDAPDASTIVWGGDGQGGMEITGLDRQSDGAYIYNAGPETMNLVLSGMAPVVRDAYQVVGADSVTGDAYTFNLANGETREVFIYYYYSTGSGSSESVDTSGSNTGGSTQATVLLTFRACPEGFVPDVDDPFVDCTIPLDAPDASVVGVWGEDSGLVPITSLERQYNGEYVYYLDSSSGYLELRSLEPVLRDDFLIHGVDDQDGSSYITLLDNGETREIFVFYYYT